MTTRLSLAILGTVLLLPMAAAAEAPAAVSGPAFLRATACEGAAPIRTESLVQRRAVRTTAPRKGVPAAAPAADAASEAEAEPFLLRRAVHFCAVAPAGRVYRT